ncbi:leishmanolysin-like peptidase [Saccoglossus kowalevskii]
MADYCPYHQELEWESDSDIIRTSHCNNPNNAPDSRYSFSLEHYGDSAVCVEQGVAWIKQQCNLISTQHQWGSGCYKHFCDADRGLVLQLGDEEYQCFYKDQILFIRIEHNDALHEGSLVCPSCQEVCGDQIVCPVEELNPPPDNRTSKVYVIPCVAGATMISDSLFSSIFRTILLIFLMVIL